MKKLSLIALFSFLLITLSYFVWAEQITLTTYYPAPYGVYKEMRAKRMAIGDNYYQGSNYYWPGEGSGGTEIDANADLIVEGNVGIGTAAPLAALDVDGNISVRGGQIKFPATAVPSADPNTLDDYEKGVTGSVTLTCGTSGTITLSASGRNLAYVKVGKLVSITGYIYVSSVSSPLGTLTLNGLPFANSALLGGAETLGFDIPYHGIYAVASGITGIVAQSATTISLRERTGANLSNDLANHIAGATQLWINFTYYTAL